MKAELGLDAVVVGDLPTGTRQVRVVINGVCTRTVPVEDDGASGVTIPCDTLLAEAPLEAQDIFPRVATVVLMAVDDRRQQLARCVTPECPLPPPFQDERRMGMGDAAGGEGSVVGTGGGRLVAASLGPSLGETHTWSFRTGVQSAPEGHNIGGLFLRAAFDDHPALVQPGTTPLVSITWSVHTPTTMDVDTPPDRKRPRLGPLLPVAWGDRMSITRIGNGCRDSCFLGALVPDPTPGVCVRCTMNWMPGVTLPTSALRYAIHGTVVPSLGLPLPPPSPPDALDLDVMTPLHPTTVPSPRCKRAVIVGVSKYTRRQRPRGGDLEWCDGAGVRRGSVLCTFTPCTRHERMHRSIDEHDLTSSSAVPIKNTGCCFLSGVNSHPTSFATAPSLPCGPHGSWEDVCGLPSSSVTVLSWSVCGFSLIVLNSS